MTQGHNLVVQPEGITIRTSDPITKTPDVTITEIPSSPTDAIPKSPTGNFSLLDPASITQEFDALRFDAAAFAQLSFTPRETSSLGGSEAGSPNESDSDAETPPPPARTARLTGLGIGARERQSFQYVPLISSPYNQPGHYLTLNTLPITSQLFALALTALKPVREDYSTAPYTSALNFDTVLEVLRLLAAQTGFQFPETSFYVVIFRSKLKPDIDNDWLYKLDFESHREACESGGLLKYWFGKTDGERRNLATCKCTSRSTYSELPQFIFFEIDEELGRRGCEYEFEC
jgi:hypothetical protein